MTEETTRRNNTDKKAKFSKQAIADGNAEKVLTMIADWGKLINHLSRAVNEKENQLKKEQTKIQNSMAAINSETLGIRPESLPRTLSNKTSSRSI